MKGIGTLRFVINVKDCLDNQGRMELIKKLSVECGTNYKLVLPI